MSKLRVGVLASGSGSILQAIIDGQDDHYEVVVVGSDVPDCPALGRARPAGIPTVVVAFPKPIEERGPASKELGDALRGHGVELACNAGFMKILAPDYFDALAVPAMNSHPALLPSFPGPHGIRDALAHGVKVTGTTIHFATPDVDAGPIIAQEPVAIAPDDTEETLHERVKQVERRLYPEVIRQFAQGRIVLEGERVRIT